MDNFKNYLKEYLKEFPKPHNWTNVIIILAGIIVLVQNYSNLGSDNPITVLAIFIILIAFGLVNLFLKLDKLNDEIINIPKKNVFINFTDKLENMENILHEETNRTIDSLNGVEIKILENPGVFFNYVKKQMWSAEESIDDLTWGPEFDLPKTSWNNAYNEYIKEIPKVCSNKEIIYREIMTFPSMERLNRAEKMIENTQNVREYYLKYYDIPQEEIPPLIEFMVIDSKEVILVFYKHTDLSIDKEFQFSIKHPRIVNLFKDYYNSIWNRGKEIKIGDRIKYEELENIRKTFVENESD